MIWNRGDRLTDSSRYDVVASGNEVEEWTAAMLGIGVTMQDNVNVAGYYWAGGCYTAAYKSDMGVT